MLYRIPTFIFVFISFGFFSAEGAALAVPILCMLLNAAVCVLLELFIYPRLEARLIKAQRPLLF
jgi:hypothetical protein